MTGMDPEIGGGPGRTRTYDQGIMSPVIAQTGASLRSGKLNRSTISVVWNCLNLRGFEYAV